MAFTERYVTVGASGGDGSSGSPWTLAESLTNAVAGDRVNIASGSYSSGADAVTNAGDQADAIVFRGYLSTGSIGDLVGQGRNTDGTLDTTNFPVITMTGTLTLNLFVVMQNLTFTGSVNSSLLGDAGPDTTVVLECSVTNTANNASAKAFMCDNQSAIINSDFECSGAASSTCVDADNNFRCVGCRIKSTGGVGLAMNYGSVVDTAILGATSSTGIQLRSNSVPSLVVGCTVYLPGASSIAITTATAANLYPLILINNHITDCNEYINNGYSATSDEWIIEINNRTRDNTTARTGIGDGILQGEITTDTGGIATDYTDAGNDDLALISAAPGKAAGMIPFTDCGAYQREEPASGDLSDYMETQILTVRLSDATVYLALFSDNPGEDASGTELNDAYDGGYLRTVISFGTPSGGSVSNDADVVFPTATADWSVITHFGIFDAISGGNMLFYGAFTTPITVLSIERLRITNGNLTVTGD